MMAERPCYQGMPPGRILGFLDSAAGRGALCAPAPRLSAEGAFPTMRVVALLTVSHEELAAAMSRASHRDELEVCAIDDDSTDSWLAHPTLPRTTPDGPTR